MTASDFINQLNFLALSEDQLRKAGFAEYSIKLHKGYFPEKSGRKYCGSDPILQLIEEYHCQSIGLISVISFGDEIRETNDFYLIGWVWGEDLLAIDKRNSEVVVLAYWDYDQVNFYCAESSELFLRAFLIHGTLNMGIFLENEQDRWEYNAEMARKAASIAGGDKYAKFWMALYPTDNGKDAMPNSNGYYN